MGASRLADNVPITNKWSKLSVPPLRTFYSRMTEKYVRLDLTDFLLANDGKVCAS